MTSESVSPGHSDKLAADAMGATLGACLGNDHNSWVACEVVVIGNRVIVAAQTTSAHAVERDLHDRVSVSVS